MPQIITPTETETYEEKRAEALDEMGLELEDIRNEERFRLAFLQSLNGGGSGSGGSGSGGANYKAYDAVIDFDADGSAFTFSIIKGSYAELASLLNNNIAPNILVKTWVINNNGLLNAKTSTSAVTLYHFDADASNPYMWFVCKIPTANNSETYGNAWKSVTFVWYADDTVAPD